MFEDYLRFRKLRESFLNSGCDMLLGDFMVLAAISKGSHTRTALRELLICNNSHIVRTVFRLKRDGYIKEVSGVLSMDTKGENELEKYIVLLN